MSAPAPIFYFDVASPNAYLAHRVLPHVERRTGVRFLYAPVLLGGLFRLSGNRAPMVAFADVPLKLAYERREVERFVARHGLDAFRMNPHFPMNTLGVMRAAAAADLQGVLPPFVEAVLRAAWEDGRKIDDEAELHAVLRAAGLPADELVASARTPAVKERLTAATTAAHARGVFGVPSFLVGDELFFGKDKLGDVERLLLDGGSAAARPTDPRDPHQPEAGHV